MPYEYILLSPEKVELRYELGGIGSRSLAAAFDDLLVILVNLLLLVGLSYAAQGLVNWGGSLSGTALAWLIAGYLFFLFCSWFGYYVVFEIFWNGQTPGKRLLGLRVIRIDGTPVTPGSIFARELLRLVDAFPTCFPPTYAIGGLVAFFNPFVQRIGDLVAGTIVIRERRTSMPELDQLSQTSQEVHPLESLIPSLQEMTADDYRVIRAFLTRQSTLEPSVRQALAEQLLAQMASRLGLLLPPDTPPEQVLEAVARRYARERGMLE